MATTNQNAREQSAYGIGDAFHQVAQGLLRVQEALRLKEQEAERRAQEAWRLQEQRAAAALREAVRQMEQERDEAIRTLRGEFSSRIQRVEERMNLVEEQLSSSPTREGDATVGEHVSIEQLDDRMQTLEASVQRALEQVFPRVEALVAQLEQHSSERASRAPPFSCATFFTTTTSTIPYLVGASSIGPNSIAPGATATGGAAEGTREEAVAGHQGAAADDEELAKQRVRLRIREVRAKMDTAEAYPSPLGEELCKAAREGRLEGVRCLLNAGADVNYTNSYGDFPLMKAVRGGRWQSGVVSLLLERGADINAINVGGVTAVHTAVWIDTTGRLVTLLISAGADVDTRDMYGATPLHWSAYMNNEAGVRALLAAGARKSLRCWSGTWCTKSPFEVARSVVLQDLLRP